ncbi:SPOR domain-containing protein [Thiorhodococcus minor]|uniref:SPOR domain-containing protein n=1 Tax=Thiorhodococcus minor TaxID=57489 RepID=A0A6M0JXV0_9GAMM|nr:hypothetical protein [Thiorhodococcus minor]
MGAVVIVALAVIFVPMLFEDDSLAPPVDTALLPDEPGFGSDFDPGLDIPLPDQPDDGSALGSTDDSVQLDVPPPESFGEPEADLSGLQPGQITGADLPPPARPADLPAPTPPQAAPSPSSRPSTAARPAAEPKPAPRTAAPPPPPPPRADAVPSWVVQVASLGSSASASALADKLKGAGFTAFVERAEVRGKTFYRVRVGPEVDRDAAERAAAMLRQQQKLDTLIQRYP